LDLRKRDVAARINDGQFIGQIAERFKIPKDTVQNLFERYHDAGTEAPKPLNVGRKPAFSGPSLRRLQQDVLYHPDTTLAELRERCGVSVSLVATLKRQDFPRKESLYMRASSAART
jgi:transposase